MRQAWQRASPWLAAIGFAGTWLLPLLRVAPNRLLSGVGMSSAHVSLVGTVLVSLAWLSMMLPRRTGIVSAGALCVGLLFFVGVAARAMPLDGHQRVQLASGFWVMIACASLAFVDGLRGESMRVRVASLALLTTAVITLAFSGVFDAMAIAREYGIQRALFLPAIVQHLLLALSATMLALLVGLPLAWLAWRRKRFRDTVLTVLNLLQTLPSIALFALLIGPLAWLSAHAGWLMSWGVGGTGAAPAVIALAIYALLPVVRYSLAGISGVPVAAIDAARGMGMSHRQVFLRVQCPLALPVLIGGLRIVAVQSIGLATVAALIGAGGLGRFVFLGLGQGANDLVMLATLAIIALALATDGLFLALTRWTEPRA